VDGPLYALLVGVARYASPTIPDLLGPVNDVRDLERGLVEDLEVPADHVRTLTDEQATRAGIEAAFAEHLIGAADAWRSAGTSDPPPAFLFTFSGHGSQALDPSGTETDGFEETLVPHDGRDTDVYDVKDHELAAWLARLPGDNVTVVLDCCHSGSGTRRPVPPAPGRGDRPSPPPDVVRAAPPDLRPQPPHPPVLAGQRRRDLSVHRAAGSHVLLAACRDHEEAFEHRGDDGFVRGALTTFLVPTLTTLVRRGGATYRDLHRAVRFEVTRVRPRQSPLCEGDLDRELLSARRAAQVASSCVLGVRTGRVWFDVGRVHGVGPGTRLGTVARDGRRLGVTLDTVEPVRSAGLLPADGDDLGARPAAGTAADVEVWELGTSRWRVHADASVVDQLRVAVSDGPLAGLVDLVTDADVADLSVVLTGSGTAVRDATRRVLVEVEDVDQLVAALAHVARFQALLRTERAGLGPDLPSSTELHLRRLVTDPVTGERTSLDLPVRDDGAAEASAGDRIVLELTHEAAFPVHASIVLLTDAWELTVLHPATPGAEDRLAPGHRVRVGLHGDALTATVPADRDVSTVLVRAVVTTHPTSLETLATAPPPGRWAAAGPLPVPAGGRPAPPDDPLLEAPAGTLPSRWLTRSRWLVTRRPDDQPRPSDAPDPPDEVGDGCEPDVSWGPASPWEPT
jgi:hypothetical protein